MKHILITGGAGFIGSNLALLLVNRGYVVTVLDKLSPQIHGPNPETDSPLFRSIIDKVKFIKGSVTSRKDLLEALLGQDAIVHLAAETGTGQSMYEIDNYVAVNCGGTALLLDVLTNVPNNVKKVIVASSRAIYGEGKYVCSEHGIVYPLVRSEKDLKAGDFSCKCPLCHRNVDVVPTSEDSKIHPTSIYGITKQNQEQMVLMVCKNLGISGVALRYQNVYGPGQSLQNPYTGILSVFSTRIRNHKSVLLFEDGYESRDFVYIEDVVNATALCLEREEAKDRVFNVGNGVRTDVRTVAETLVKHYGIDVPVDITATFRVGDIRHNFADSTLIETVLGFKPKWTFDAGIKAFTNWVLTQEIMVDRYDASIEEMKQKGLYK
ncbi:MAG TPA: epimerase [Bacteroidales bacterium]|jgi:dTDP-L-rhamnose 4-epimerase|nr:epimerase [Bacteroidales bacterium]